MDHKLKSDKSNHRGYRPAARIERMCCTDCKDLVPRRGLVEVNLAARRTMQGEGLDMEPARRRLGEGVDSRMVEGPGN